ncbi:alkaline phosphatase family protein [Sorangium sp. So ce119]|uniref:alkaline phosphatase family protein n=1 Tax=Sorangium sp. So ce119 TaxID=3133279 RepID=UPI003F5E3B11
MAAHRDRVLVAFVDALGPSQLARFEGALPSLPHRRALEGVLGYSSGALATVLTGAPPAVHGRMCLFTARAPGAPGLLDPLRWLGLLPRIVHERAAVRRWLSRALARAAGLTGYVALHRVPPEAFRWLDLPEREDLFQARDVGGARTFLSDARAAGISVYAAPWQLAEPARWEHAHGAIRRQRPDLAFLYAAELDATLHAGGGGTDAAAAVMRRIGAHIERAREEMGRGGARVTTLVVGDHGMADVHTFIDPRGVVARLARLASVRVFVDSTMLRLWGDDAALERARRLVEGAGFPGRFLDLAALEARRAPTGGAAYGRAMFLLDEGAIFAPSYVGGRVNGMHGYDLGTPSSRAALASDAPLPEGVSAIADVAPLVRRRLGLAA